jgi:hypothetical protein
MMIIKKIAAVAYRDHKVFLDCKGRKVFKGFLEHKVSQDNKEYKDHKDFKVLLENAIVMIVQIIADVVSLIATFLQVLHKL